MKKYIVLSVNDNVDYLYFTPLTCWAWRKLGWEPIVFYRGELDNKAFDFVCGTTADNGIDFHLLTLPAIAGYRDDTLTQVSRLYGACVVEDDAYLMTGDIDMLPLSDYWQPHPGKVTLWGHDLTGFKNFPICYIGMPAHTWKMIMKIDSTDYNALIKRDLDTLPKAKSESWYDYWETDQDLITQRIKEYGTGHCDLVTRGQGRHGFARGRVDRGQGGWVLDQPILIDCHMQQQTHHKLEKVERLYKLLAHVWPNENLKWFADYTEEFRRLDNKTE